MKVFSVTKENPEGFDRFELFATEELAEAMAQKWVDDDRARLAKYAVAEGPNYVNENEWRWIEEYRHWAYGSENEDGTFFSIYEINVREMDVLEALPEEDPNEH